MQPIVFGQILGPETRINARLRANVFDICADCKLEHIEFRWPLAGFFHRTRCHYANAAILMTIIMMTTENEREMPSEQTV